MEPVSRRVPFMVTVGNHECASPPDGSIYLLNRSIYLLDKSIYSTNLYRMLFYND